MRRRCHSGRHGRRRVAGHSLSVLISLRNGRRGERDVALRRAARCSTAVCLLLADCSPVALCHPQAGRPRRLQRGSETQGLLPRSVNSDRRPRPRSRRVGRAGVHEVGAGARSCCSRLTRVVSSFSWPVVLTTSLLVSFYSFLVCWRSADGAGMVVVVVVLVERLMAREKRRQELRLRAAVQNKTSRPLPTPERACPGEVKPEPPPAGPTRGVYQVS